MSILKKYLVEISAKVRGVTESLLQTCEAVVTVFEFSSFARPLRVRAVPLVLV